MKKIWENHPWMIDEQRYRRFNQKYTMFSRTGWDQKIQEIARKTVGSVLRNINSAKKSSLLDYALKSAGWWVSMKASPHQMDRGDGGLVSWNSDISPVFSIASSPWNENPQLEEERRKFKQAVEKKPEIMSEIVKRASHFLGADLVGIAQFDERWVYSHRIMNPRYHPGKEFSEESLDLPEGIRYCIVLVFEEDYDMYSTADGGVAMADVGFGYSRMAITAGSVAEFLRALGFTAIPSGNDLAISIPYAISAGLGEYSRMGLLITRKFGPRIRIAKVFTDAPLAADKPIRFGVYEFCTKCKKCAEKCPSQSIPYGEPEWEGKTISNASGVYKWYVDVEKCFEYWCTSGSLGCGVCVRVCPYNKPTHKPSYPIHALFRDYISRIVGGNIGKIIDDMLGYGRRKKPSEWWGVDYDRLVGVS